MKVKRTFLLSEEERLELLEVKKNFPSQKAGVYIGEHHHGVQTNHRDTTRYNIELHNFNQTLINKFTDFINEEGVVANQTDYLEYGEGQFFEVHQDTRGKVSPEEVSGRVWSSSTLIDQTDDLEGGELLLYGPVMGNVKQNRPMRINLEIGETVFFPSYYFHEVTPVTKGLRTALVVWLGDNHEGVMKRHGRVNAKRKGATFL